MTTAAFKSVTVFAHAKATAGIRREDVSLEDMAKEVNCEAAGKTSQQLIRLGTFPEDSRAAGKELDDFCGVQLDYDGDKPMKTTVAQFKRAGIAAMVYETWTKGRHRALIPTDKNYPPDQLAGAIAQLEIIAPGFAPESAIVKQGAFIGRPAGETRKAVVVPGAPLVVKPFATVTPISSTVEGISAWKYVKARVKELGRSLRDGDGRWIVLQKTIGSLASRHAPGDVLLMLTKACGHPGYFYQPDMTASAIGQYVERAVKILRKEERTQAPDTFWEDDLTPVAPEMIVYGLLEARTLAMLYGQWGTWKTFIVLELLLCLATGRSFLGKFRVPKPKRVAYIAGEGKGGVVRRIAGWNKDRELAAAIRISRMPGRAVDAKWWDSLPDDFDLLAIDPLLANFGDGEPNRDGHKIVQNAQSFIRRTGATVVLVHHVNLSGSEYGGVMLPNLCDTKLRAERVGRGVKLIHEKAKDAETWRVPIGIAARIVELDLMDEGKPVTTLVLDEDESITLEGKTRTGTVARRSLQAVAEIYKLSEEHMRYLDTALKFFSDLLMARKKFERGALGTLAKEMGVARETARNFLISLSQDRYPERGAVPCLFLITQMRGAKSPTCFKLAGAGIDYARQAEFLKDEGV